MGFLLQRTVTFDNLSFHTFITVMPFVKNSNKRMFVLFLIFWGILNLLQAIFTPLHNDEAYYWMYSKYPAWGYYDHPPMIALFIGMGYAIFKSVLGVRLFIVISQLATLSLTWILIRDSGREKHKNPFVFMLLVALIPVLNIYGFIATPDAPLMLFTALFLLAYRRFIERESVQNVLLLGISMAALAYSKYHGGLLVILVIISNIRLLISKKFYLASSVALILFLPHILWQINNGFPSFKYHLVDRVSGFDLANVPEYLLNQLVIHNPLILIVTLLLIFKRRPGNQFEKSLWFIIAGFLIFFFISCFRYHVEPHWTALISIPVLILLTTSPGDDMISGRLLKWTAVAILPLILIGRIALMADFLPVAYLKKEIHDTKNRMIQISKVAGDRPVVFTNSYQDPSQYSFHTGHFAHSLNNLAYRRTQYDIWDFEERLNGREVLYVPHWLTPDYKKNLTKYMLPGGDSLFARVFTDFQSLQRECVIIKDDSLSFKKEQYQSIQLDLFNPYPYLIRLDHREMPVHFYAAFFREGLLKSEFRISLPDTVRTIFPGDTLSVRCSFYPGNIPSGKYRFAITSEAGCLYKVMSSKLTEALITD
jgi:hypothetical protein